MILGSKARRVREANNLTDICEPIVYIVRDPRHLTNLQAFTACNGDWLTLFVISILFLLILLAVSWKQHVEMVGKHNDSA
jgi:hypothetical protein